MSKKSPHINKQKRTQHSKLQKSWPLPILNKPEMNFRANVRHKFEN